MYLWLDPSTINTEHDSETDKGHNDEKYKQGPKLGFAQIETKSDWMMLEDKNHWPRGLYNDI